MSIFGCASDEQFYKELFGDYKISMNDLRQLFIKNEGRIVSVDAPSIDFDLLNLDFLENKLGI